MSVAWPDYLGADDVEKKPADGNYYCGCAYVRGEDNCVHHGDPVEHWPNSRRESEG